LAKKCANELEKAIEKRTAEKDSLLEIVDVNTKNSQSNSILMEMRRRVWLEICKISFEFLGLIINWFPVPKKANISGASISGIPEIDFRHMVPKFCFVGALISNIFQQKV